MNENPPKKIIKKIKNVKFVKKKKKKKKEKMVGWAGSCPKVLALFRLTGVRQGTVISPTLFSIFINGLATDNKSLDNGVTCEDYSLTPLCRLHRPSHRV